MAITTTVSTDRVPATQKPSTYSDPVVSDLSGNIASSKFETEIDATGNVDSNEATAFGNIATAVGTWLTGTYLPTTLGVNASDTIVARGYLESVALKDTDQWTTDNRAFICKGTVVWSKS